MRIKGLLSYCIALVMCLSASLTSAQTQSQAQVEGKQLREEGVIQQIIQLVVENNPTLQQAWSSNFHSTAPQSREVFSSKK